MAGGMVSLTVTVKLQLLALPLESWAVQVTVVVPTAKLEALAGTHEKLLTLQLSVAVAVKLTIWAQPLVTFVTMAP